MADINQNDLILFSACICCFNALYTDFPGLVGCSGKGECLCLENEHCLRLNTPAYPIACESNKNGNICDLALCCCMIALKSPKVLCKGKNQCLCCVNQAAFPPDNDVPAMLAYCFVSCYPKFGVAVKVGDNK